MGPLLSNLHANPQSFRSSAAITMLSLYKEVADEIEKIKKYDDGKFPNTLYKRTVTVVHDALSKMRFGEAQQSTVAQYCLPLKSGHYRQELEKRCIFDSALIDMNIIHSIVSSPKDSCIFVVAGGAHIEQISEVLKRMGYESVLATHQRSRTTLKKVLNSDSATTVSDVHPEPVDIAIIDRYIN
jgi:hypothetical protein